MCHVLDVAADFHVSTMSISEKQICKLGFIRNPDYEHPAFDEWRHKDFPQFGIGDFNGEGYLIEGIDWHKPISRYRDLVKIVNVLTSR